MQLAVCSCFCSETAEPSSVGSGAHSKSHNVPFVTQLLHDLDKQDEADRSITQCCLQMCFGSKLKLKCFKSTKTLFKYWQLKDGINE